MLHNSVTCQLNMIHIRASKSYMHLYTCVIDITCQSHVVVVMQCECTYNGLTRERLYGVGGWVFAVALHDGYSE